MRDTPCSVPHYVNFWITYTVCFTGTSVVRTISGLLLLIFVDWLLLRFFGQGLFFKRL
jgi:hypothetical protein